MKHGKNLVIFRNAFVYKCNTVVFDPSAVLRYAISAQTSLKDDTSLIVSSSCTTTMIIVSILWIIEEIFQ